MKKVLKSVLLIVVMVTTLMVKGNNVIVNINEKSKVINLEFKNNDGELRIIIKDGQGEILHAEKYKGLKFSKTFDFKSVPNGDYYIEVEGETKVKVFPLAISRKGVELIKNEEAVYFKPIIRRVEDKLFISKLNLKQESMAIYFYNEDNVLLYKSVLNEQLNLETVLNIKYLKSGSYDLVLETRNKTFSKKIIK